MQIIDLTAAQIGKHLGRSVTELEVAIAKNLVLGVPREALKEILGPECTVAEIELLQQDEGFKAVYGFIAQYVMTQNANTTMNWDQVEAMALTNLVTTIRNNKDPELNLRVAAVANKAVRRHNKGEQVLDPMGGGQKVTIQLTERFIRKLSGKGSIEESVERSVRLDQVRNPSLDELTSLFSPATSVASPEDLLRTLHREDSASKLVYYGDDE